MNAEMEISKNSGDQQGVSNTQIDKINNNWIDAKYRQMAL
jgi:hypothetical protein